METQQVRDLITSNKIKKKTLSLKGINWKKLMNGFAFPPSDRNSQTSKKFQPCFQSFFPFPLSFPTEEKSPGNKVDSP